MESRNPAGTEGEGVVVPVGSAVVPVPKAQGALVMASMHRHHTVVLAAEAFPRMGRMLVLAAADIPQPPVVVVTVVAVAVTVVVDTLSLGGVVEVEARVDSMDSRTPNTLCMELGLLPLLLRWWLKQWRILILGAK